MRRKIVGIAVAALTGSLGACAPSGEEIAEPSAQATVEPAGEVSGAAGTLPRVLANDGFAVMIADAGPVYIAGQPSAKALEEMKAEGVKRVINLRTEAEMANRDVVPFDEAEKLDALGMEYVLIPQGPEETLTPAAVDAFAAAMADADGKVLVHCGSGVRASHMWAAYLVREKGMDLEAALAQAEAMNLKSEAPVRALLGIDG